MSSPGGTWRKWLEAGYIVVPVAQWHRAVLRHHTGVVFGVAWTALLLRLYIEGCFYIVRTDHRALCCILNLKNPANRLACWWLLFTEVGFEIQDRSGRRNMVAEALFRLEPKVMDDNNSDEDLPDQYDKNVETITENTKTTDDDTPNPENRRFPICCHNKRRTCFVKIRLISQISRREITS